MQTYESILQRLDALANRPHTPRSDRQLGAEAAQAMRELMGMEQEAEAIAVGDMPAPKKAKKSAAEDESPRPG